MDKRVKRSRCFRFDGWYLRVRRERLLGGFSGRGLTHPGIGWVPNALNPTPQEVTRRRQDHRAAAAIIAWCAMSGSK
jgi:hypothetical protein